MLVKIRSWQHNDFIFELPCGPKDQLMSKKEKILGLGLAALLAVAGLTIYITRQFPISLKRDILVKIPVQTTLSGVEDSLIRAGVLTKTWGFRLLASRMNYRDGKIRPGLYRIRRGTGLVSLIRMLRSGDQFPVAVTLTTERMPEDVAGKLSRYLSSDSISFIHYFQNNPLIGTAGFTRENLHSVFIPNTYEIYWTASPTDFLHRMKTEWDRFWKGGRRFQRAKSLGLTPQEVYTLASIVDKETLVSDEQKRIAGVYYNRLRIGMPLQADPTAVFARRDFSTRRVTDFHTKFDSPYNTYRYKGLPPGPITMASVGAIDAVLQPEKHAYLYFCALGDESGRHAFAVTLSAHNRNAAIYRENLKRRGLR